MIRKYLCAMISGFHISLFFSRLFHHLDYICLDGEHSCVYIPKHTYKRLNKKLIKSLEDDPKAENSLRFVWTKDKHGYILCVNPKSVDLTQTNGLTTDSEKRVIIPCAYLQHMYQNYGLPPSWCGRMYLKEINIPNCICAYRLVGI